MFEDKLKPDYKNLLKGDLSNCYDTMVDFGWGKSITLTKILFDNMEKRSNFLIQQLEINGFIIYCDLHFIGNRFKIIQFDSEIYLNHSLIFTWGVNMTYKNVFPHIRKSLKDFIDNNIYQFEHIRNN